MELSEKLNGKANGLSKKCHFEKSQWLVNGCINPKKVLVTFVLHLKKKKKKTYEVTIKAYRNDSRSYSTTYPTCDSTNVYAKNNYTLIQSNEI